MASEDKLQQNRELMKQFIIDKPIPKAFKANTPYDAPPYGYIYCIENKTNHKKYIGSVYSNWNDIKNPNLLNPLKKRASHYLYEYNCVKENKNTSKHANRPIIKAMAEEGFDNFIMYPIAETIRSNHKDIEKYFIDLFDTIKNGYNLNNQGEGLYPSTKIHAMTNDAKRLRSEKIISINMNNKQIVLSDSMKLFGDYLGTSKDMVKNSVRKGKPCRGWFSFYINNDKRIHILNTAVLNDQNARTQDRHSDKAKAFYKGLYDTVSLYINEIDPKSKSEYFPDFELLPSLEYKDDKLE
jgi:hypothetical protein